MSESTFPDGSSEALTRGVRVRVQPQFLPDHSDISKRTWVYAYHVTVSNEGTGTVQLLSRHWIITNAEGKEEHVRGPGVVGEQPLLRPGQSFRYTSGCSLKTPTGTMHGTYQMTTPEGDRFDARIAPFTLAQPYDIN